MWPQNNNKQNYYKVQYTICEIDVIVANNVTGKYVNTLGAKSG